MIAKIKHTISYSMKQPEYDVAFIERNFGAEEANRLDKYITDLYGWWTPKHIVQFCIAMFISVPLLVGFIFLLIFLSM